ncbi:serine/threonine-protein kinase [Sphaerisporangium perillae]|uniref:serine/threonine-protein kinase n=1 Tax=Sphaerisporangium perillae TaxID=2935860 RepID=UPI00200E4618|nr:serine/threonine-protein kinase [Sphaerisporangium perillae]
MPEIGPLGRGDPQQLGPFRLIGRLGEGGQGVVYLGQNDAGERAAVKLLHVKFTGDLTARSRFARELKAAERVASFCTARVISADLDGDTPYIASEYIEGWSLREAVEAGGPMSGSALERLAIGTATALTAIHHAGIVHRDFKPDNVLMAADGPRVVDFGIARILDSTGTITSRAVGTPAYMAPEQISGGEVGPAADVFAWGSTIAFAATGSAPFGGTSIAVVLNRVLNHEADLSTMPEPLRGVVRACLNKSPGARPTADRVLLRLLGHAEAADASTAVLSQGAEVAGGDTMPPVPAWQTPENGTRAVRVPSGRSRRRRWAVAAAAVLALAGGAFAVQRFWGPGFALGTGGGPPASPTPSTGGTSHRTPTPSPPAQAVRFFSVVDKTAKTRKLTIAMRDLVPGVALHGQDGWHGFEVEVGTYIARQLGVPASGVTFRASSMAERVSLLDSGKADLVIATYSVNSADPVTFAGPYYTAHVDVLVREGAPFAKVADLKGRKLCAPGSNASVRVIQSAVDVQLVPVGTYADCMDLMRRGDVDAVPGDDLLLAGFANREQSRYKVLGARLTDERYAVAVKRGDVRACRAVRGAIAQMYSDGTVNDLLKKYFSKVDFKPDRTTPAPAACD